MTTVPCLVGNNALSHAIQALSNQQRYIERHRRNISDTELSDEAQLFRRRSLRSAKKALHLATYQKSQDLMVTALILSTYEMLRDDREAWRQNLQGVSCILRSRDTDPESPGLESAVWWAWLRQEVWAAFRDGRRVDDNTWAPTKACAGLNESELLARAVWIRGQVVDFCAGDPNARWERDLHEKVLSGNKLRDLVEEWRSAVPAGHAIPAPVAKYKGSGVFKPMALPGNPLLLCTSTLPPPPSRLL